MKLPKRMIYTTLAMVVIVGQANFLFAQSPIPPGITVNSLNTMDVTGKMWRQTNYTELSGSPYLSNEWGKSVIKFGNNSIANGIDLKYDQISEVLLFKNSKGEVMEVADPVVEFKIAVPKKSGAEAHLFRAGFKPVGKNNELTYYEVLSDGNVKFLKKTIKSIIEEKEYNSSTTTNKVVDKTYYYVVKADGVPVVVNKNETEILNAIGDKKTELTTYIKDQKLSLKKDEDVLKLFEYYFTISKA